MVVLPEMHPLNRNGSARALDRPNFLTEQWDFIVEPIADPQVFEEIPQNSADLRFPEHFFSDKTRSQPRFDQGWF